LRKIDRLRILKVEITFDLPVRIPVLLLSVALCFSATPRLHGQDPAAQQDAEAAREKLLKAEDELENIQANSEATKTSVDGMKTDMATLQATVTKLQMDNAALRQQVVDLQAALDQYKADQIKERQTLIDNVADMIAAAQKSAKSTKKKKDVPAADTTTEPSTEVHTPEAQAPASSLAPPPDPGSNPPGDSTSAGSAGWSADSTPPAPKPQKGYYHVVASGETLRLICEAYRANGVNVSITAVRKANGLTEDSTLKVGQKLFIPKPGT
jgi:TolA-binding protein